MQALIFCSSLTVPTSRCFSIFCERVCVCVCVCVCVHWCWGWLERRMPDFFCFAVPHANPCVAWQASYVSLYICGPNICSKKKICSVTFFSLMHGSLASAWSASILLHAGSASIFTTTSIFKEHVFWCGAFPSLCTRGLRSHTLVA
jgi:hypothetical protein